MVNKHLMIVCSTHTSASRLSLAHPQTIKRMQHVSCCIVHSQIVPDRPPALQQSALTSSLDTCCAMWGGATVKQTVCRQQTHATAHGKINSKQHQGRTDEKGRTDAPTSERAAPSLPCLLMNRFLLLPAEFVVCCCFTCQQKCSKQRQGHLGWAESPCCTDAQQLQRSVLNYSEFTAHMHHADVLQSCFVAAQHVHKFTCPVAVDC